MSKKIAVIIEVDEDAVKSASEMESLTDAIDSELGWVSASGLAIQGWSYLPEEPEDPTFTVPRYRVTFVSPPKHPPLRQPLPKQTKSFLTQISVLSAISTGKHTMSAMLTVTPSERSNHVQNHMHWIRPV